jgi:hypothetical protein
MMWNIDWIDLAQDRERQRALVTGEVNFQGLKNEENFLTN